jgi:hypothetical protein
MKRGAKPDAKIIPKKSAPERKEKREERERESQTPV